MENGQFVMKTLFQRIFVIGILCSCSLIGFSQTKIVLEIKSNFDNSPISGVTVTFSQNRLLSIGKTNELGILQAEIKANGKITMSCTHPNFEGFERTLELDKDSLFFAIKMKPIRFQEVREVVVKPPGAVDTVFSSNRISVADFEVLNDGNLMLLTYSKRLTKGAEMILFDGNTALTTFPVPGIADHLERDYRGNVHVLCKDKVFTILPKGLNLQIAQLDKDYYYRYISPILDTSGKDLYYSDFNKNYPEFSFWKFDAVDSLYDKLRTIRDDLMMELYRSEYKWVDVRTQLWAKNLEFQTGIDAEIWVGANYFTRSIYYKELYAPFFKVGEELVVFDYYSDKLFRHTLNGELKSEVIINHHLNRKETGWKNHLIQDRVTGNVYAWFEKAGTSFLGKINLNTGEIPALYQLNFKYLDKIEIHDNSVYYVYRPFESPQKKFLYKEKLPQEFTE